MVAAKEQAKKSHSAKTPDWLKKNQNKKRKEKSKAGKAHHKAASSSKTIEDARLATQAFKKRMAEARAVQRHEKYNRKQHTLWHAGPVKAEIEEHFKIPKDLHPQLHCLPPEFGTMNYFYEPLDNYFRANSRLDLIELEFHLSYELNFKHAMFLLHFGFHFSYTFDVKFRSADFIHRYTHQVQDSGLDSTFPTDIFIKFTDNIDEMKSTPGSFAKREEFCR
ncbi:hypothetical protein M501DRAFT_1013392 [Patellaria atrata CBS 101060]|uniref:Uncharacterized protein n=1 Tax=Patellaria atrata CBS 101060 TaxID=1346257 RepID=A0A9P4VSG6_9PEZI|nr:hypothetical protein M501DRAFT_1013392 [Patellaria atrata CBS 101060]